VAHFEKTRQKLQDIGEGRFEPRGGGEDFRDLIDAMKGDLGAVRISVSLTSFTLILGGQRYFISRR
jgi:hypothetical protein